jgi:hypothetical protein
MARRTGAFLSPPTIEIDTVRKVSGHKEPKRDGLDIPGIQIDAVRKLSARESPRFDNEEDSRKLSANLEQRRKLSGGYEHGDRFEGRRMVEESISRTRGRLL